MESHEAIPLGIAESIRETQDGGLVGKCIGKCCSAIRPKSIRGVRVH